MGPKCRWVGAAGLALLLFSGAPAQADLILNEGFDNLAASGWTLINKSSPAGATNWFQGNDGVFPAYSGAADSYAAANYLSAGPGGDISNWLISPEVELSGTYVFKFWTKADPFGSLEGYADRLEVRLSTAGGSTNVGSSAISLGDFTTLLVTINPGLDLNGYPSDWTEYEVALSGLPATSGRLAFRYFVNDTSLNGNYIGVDSVSLDKIPEPGTLALTGGGLAALALVARRRRRA